MKTRKDAVREWLDKHYPETSSFPLDHAIVEARRLFRNDQEYYAAINQSRNADDSAYERWREEN